jgi:SAM-dependent methyltransferase
MKLAVLILLYGWLAHWVSYRLEKNRVLKRGRWDLNICCGKTDGGGINADIVRHADLPDFLLVDDIYRLPFADRQFRNVLCSHTLEHVEDPQRFFAELKRVGESVTVVVPPLYDIFAVFDLFEHRTIFLTFKKVHSRLPRFFKLPLATTVQRRFGQINHA